MFANPDGSVMSGRDAVRSASLAPASCRSRCSSPNRWPRDAGSAFGGRAWAERRFPWHAVDMVAVRRAGARRAKTILVGARSDSELYRTPATAERFRRELRAFAVCDLSASAMPVDEVTMALRAYGGDRWRED